MHFLQADGIRLFSINYGKRYLTRYLKAKPSVWWHGRCFTDFSDVAVKALAYVKKLKASGAKEVIVLHVIDERGNESVIRILGEN